MVTLMVQLTLSMAGREPDRQLDRQTAPRPNGRDSDRYLESVSVSTWECEGKVELSGVADKG